MDGLYLMLLDLYYKRGVGGNGVESQKAMCTAVGSISLHSIGWGPFLSGTESFP